MARVANANSSAILAPPSSTGLRGRRYICFFSWFGSYFRAVQHLLGGYGRSRAVGHGEGRDNHARRVPRVGLGAGAIPRPGHSNGRAGGLDEPAASGRLERKPGCRWQRLRLDRSGDTTQKFKLKKDVVPAQ